MTIAEQIRQIMLSEGLSNAEKLERLHALVPANVCKIDNLDQATPAQLRQLRDCIAITQAMPELRRRTAGKEWQQLGLDAQSIRRTTYWVESSHFSMNTYLYDTALASTDHIQ
jgi:hypothetical protein